MEHEKSERLLYQFWDWQKAFVKLTALLGVAMLATGLVGLLFMRGVNWRPADLPTLLHLSFGTFVGFYSVALIMSSVFYTVRAIRVMLKH